MVRSALHAQTSATHQPIIVHPSKKFTRKIPAKSDLSRPMMDGRK
jgi:hypothetical protein